MRYELITPENLHSVWNYVSVGLARVQKASPERWIAEDIYAQCKYLRAHLYLGFDGDKRRGFFITQPLKQPFSNQTYLNVWVLWAEPTTGDNYADVAQFIAETIEFIDQCALHIKAGWIQCTGRFGWSRYLKGYFEAKQVIYEREVEL